MQGTKGKGRVIVSARDDCYRLIQEVAVKASGKCQRPSCHNPAHCGHHIFKRDRLATAFRPDCVVGLCIACHYEWAHGEPDEFRDFMIARMGERYYELQRLSNSVVRNFNFIQCRNDLRRMLCE
jgi:hypothetical protein